MSVDQAIQLANATLKFAAISNARVGNVYAASEFKINGRESDPMPSTVISYAILIKEVQEQAKQINEAVSNFEESRFALSEFESANSEVLKMQSPR